jgi:hypothetical protein
MKPRVEANPDTRVIARDIVRRTREAWLSDAWSPGALNGIGRQETKKVARGAASGPCGDGSGRRPWASIFLALAVVVGVLAAELWVAREAPSFDGTAARQIVADVSSALSPVARASLVGPVD